MPIEPIIKQIVVLQAEIDGIRQVHEYPPGSLNAFPCFVNFSSTPGHADYLPSQRKIRQIVKMHLYITKQLTALAEKELRPFRDRVLDKFDQNIQLNGTCAYSEISDWDQGKLPYGKNQYSGIVFDLLVIEHTARTFNV